MICAIVWGETDELGRLNNSPDDERHRHRRSRRRPSRRRTGAHLHLRRPGHDRRRHPLPVGAVDLHDPRARRRRCCRPVGTVDSGDNLALAATVVDVSSEFSAGFAAELAIDGDLATEWSTSGDGDDGSITIDLGATLDIAAVEFVTRSMADGSAITSSFTVSDRRRRAARAVPGRHAPHRPRRAVGRHGSCSSASTSTSPPAATSALRDPRLAPLTHHAGGFARSPGSTFPLGAARLG